MLSVSYRSVYLGFAVAFASTFLALGFQTKWKKDSNSTPLWQYFVLLTAIAVTLYAMTYLFPN